MVRPLHRQTKRAPKGGLRKSSSAAGKLLIFDIGGVLLRHDDNLLCENIAAACERAELARAHVMQALKDPLLGTGQADVEQLHRGFANACGFQGDLPLFVDLWSSHFSGMPEMVPLVEHLARHYRVVLFSNTNEAHWSHISRHYRVLSYAHTAYLSHQLGLMKPDPASFRRVMDQEGRSPSECLFIDDRVPNVDAAREAGMTAIEFSSRDELVRELADWGIEVTASFFCEPQSPD